MPEVSRNILVITVGVPLTMVGLKPYAKPPFKDKTLVNSDFPSKSLSSCSNSLTFNFFEYHFIKNKIRMTVIV